MKRIFTLFFLVIFCLSQFSGYGAVLSYMPEPGQMIFPNNVPYSLPYIVGMRFDSDDIFNFTLILNKGDAPVKEEVLRAEINKVGKYFLAALTIPENDLWVNLSPYEQNRVITTELGLTDMGKDLLGEDYVLKQLASSLTFPDSESGKKYWAAANNYTTPYGGRSATNSRGALDAGVRSSFTKIWIIPGAIKMTEARDRVVIDEATLKVLTEEDYLATQQNNVGVGSKPTHDNGQVTNLPLQGPSTAAMRNIIVPLIEKEVNTGKHFAQLRQLYSAIIMAGWFKRKLKDTVLNQIYFNQKKIKGADGNDPVLKEKIYNEYVKAFNHGVYNYVKKESVGANPAGAGQANYSPAKKIVKRQYFSGGACLTAAAQTKDDVVPGTVAKVDAGMRQAGGNVEAAVSIKPIDTNAGSARNIPECLMAGDIQVENVNHIFNGDGKWSAVKNPVRAAAIFVLAQMEQRLPFPILGDDKQNSWISLMRAQESFGDGAKPDPAQEKLLQSVEYAHNVITHTDKRDPTPSEFEAKINYVMKHGGASEEAAMVLFSAGVLCRGDIKSFLKRYQVTTEQRVKRRRAVAAGRKNGVADIPGMSQAEAAAMGELSQLKDVLDASKNTAEVLAANKNRAVDEITKIVMEIDENKIADVEKLVHNPSLVFQLRYFAARDLLDVWFAQSLQRFPGVEDAGERMKTFLLSLGNEELLAMINLAFEKALLQNRLTAAFEKIPGEKEFERAWQAHEYKKDQKKPDSSLPDEHGYFKRPVNTPISVIRETIEILVCGRPLKPEELSGLLDERGGIIKDKEKDYKELLAGVVRREHNGVYTYAKAKIVAKIRAAGPAGDESSDGQAASISTGPVHREHGNGDDMSRRSREHEQYFNFGASHRGLVNYIRSHWWVWCRWPSGVTRAAALQVLASAETELKLPILIDGDRASWVELADRKRNGKKEVRGTRAQEKLLAAIEYAHAEIAKGKKIEGTADHRKGEMELTQDDVVQKMLHLIHKGGATVEAAAVLAAAGVIGEEGSRGAANKANGGFDFAKTNSNSEVETVGGGLRLSAKNSADSLTKNDITGFKLTITSLRYQ